MMANLIGYGFGEKGFKNLKFFNFRVIYSTLAFILILSPMCVITFVR